MVRRPPLSGIGYELAKCAASEGYEFHPIVSRARYFVRFVLDPADSFVDLDDRRSQCRQKRFIVLFLLLVQRSGAIAFWMLAISESRCVQRSAGDWPLASWVTPATSVSASAASR